MTDIIAQNEAERFLRTVQVITQTALAAYDISRSRRDGASGVTFLALAAKGVEDFRFPAAGLASSDQLLLARLLREGAKAGSLEIQAQGLAGLAAYANKPVRIRIGDTHHFDGVFDRDGRFLVDLEAKHVTESDLADIEVRLPA